MREQHQPDDEGERICKELQDAVLQSIRQYDPIRITPDEDGGEYVSLAAVCYAFFETADIEMSGIDHTHWLSQRRSRMAHALMRVEDEQGEEHLVVSFSDALVYLSDLSHAPAVVAYVTWAEQEYIPALLEHGEYAPSRGHQPLPGDELTQLERRENMRLMFSDDPATLRQVIQHLGAKGSGA